MTDTNEVTTAKTSLEMMTLLRGMSTIREFDTQARLMIERGHAGGEVHQSIGQEAVAVGVCSELQAQDYVTSTHRSHGHIIAKGGNTYRMMAEIVGRAEGYCGGKGGSMHIMAFAEGIIGANAIVGGGVPHALGAAFAAKYRGEPDAVAVTFFGDGGSNQGIVSECMNLAVIWGLPVVFVCENNHYAGTFAAAEATGGAGIAARAAAFGLHSARVDGMDVLAVATVAGELISRARAGEGPGFIEADTYRFRGHFSSEEAILKESYRSADEMELWKGRDPINSLKRRLLDAGVTEAAMSAQDGEVRNQITQDVERALQAEFPNQSAVFDDMYAEQESTLQVEGW